MRVLMLIAVAGAFALLLKGTGTDAEPQGGGSVAQSCVFNGKFCSGKFTTNCCTDFCLVQKGKANGVCAPDPKTCLKNGKSCVSSFKCCSGACVFDPVGNCKGV